jgi:hypothetical protein
VENPHNCRLQKAIFVRPLQLSTLLGVTDYSRAPKKIRSGASRMRLAGSSGPGVQQPSMSPGLGMV